MDYAHAYTLVVQPGLRLLPAKMDTPEARAMLLAIGMQESRFTDRKQKGKGPARGFYQFEEGGGYAGVLTHRSTEKIIDDILSTLEIQSDEGFTAITYNDALATVFARLLLYTDPNPLPSLTARSEDAWNYYYRNWRPGKPHRETWNKFLLEAREFIKATQSTIYDPFTS